MTVKINRTAGKAPRPIVNTLVGEKAFPLILVLKHKNDKPLVIPSSGINTPIEPGVATPVKVKSFDQAWLLVTDLSEFAHRADNNSDDFAVLAGPPAEDVDQKAAQLTQVASAEIAPVDPIEVGGTKPGKTKETK